MRAECFMISYKARYTRSRHFEELPPPDTGDGNAQDRSDNLQHTTYRPSLPCWEFFALLGV
ncbi:hypothetical protein E2C01_064970 [Portunus trituberculatus]|uniref:Uncharacterized protein n=1 Tax=Portunus trituberculatus TaxID=210409 RepID=A0A5B7HLA5_PORTR|nr:hypothetical protein [Portunus trituberculatus]